jgi:hypothetical protein
VRESAVSLINKASSQHRVDFFLMRGAKTLIKHAVVVVGGVVAVVGAIWGKIHFAEGELLSLLIDSLIADYFVSQRAQLCFAPFYFAPASTVVHWSVTPCGPGGSSAYRRSTGYARLDLRKSFRNAIKFPRCEQCCVTSSSSSSSFPVLGLLRIVTGVTKLYPSIISKVFLNFFSLLVGILQSFLGFCQS